MCVLLRGSPIRFVLKKTSEFRGRVIRHKFRGFPRFLKREGSGFSANFRMRSVRLRFGVVC